MRDFPAMSDHTGRPEPVPRRVRAVLGGRTIVDTVTATYGWDTPRYPQFHIPLADVLPGVLVDGAHPRQLPHGPARRHGLRVGAVTRADAATVYGDDAREGIAGTVCIDWDAVDAWYEEDEEVFVHPRNPYTRVDALRSSRTVRVELDGVLLAESSSPVLVFETGLPTRYYLDRTTVDFGRLVPTDTVSACPYKGRTSRYWSARTGPAPVEDVAWAYDFPTRQLLPIAGLVAFYNEAVDISVDGVRRERPTTHLR